MEGRQVAVAVPARRERRRALAAVEQKRRRHGLDARQWFGFLAPRLYAVDRESGARVRTGFRNVIEDGEHR